MTALIGPGIKQIVASIASIAGVSAADKNIGRFVSAALGAGYGSEQILQFVTDRLGNKGQDQQKRFAEERRESGAARPDERAELAKSERGASSFIPIAAALGAAGLSMRSGQGVAQAAKPVVEDLKRMAQQGQIPGQVGAPPQELSPAPQTIPSGPTIPMGLEAPQGEAPRAEDLNYFERALEGIGQLRPQKNLSAVLTKFKKQLDRLEKKMVPFEDPKVQKSVMGLRSLAAQEEVQQAAAPVSQQPIAQPGAPQTQGGDEEFDRLLSMMEKRFMV